MHFKFFESRRSPFLDGRLLLTNPRPFLDLAGWFRLALRLFVFPTYQ